MDEEKKVMIQNELYIKNKDKGILDSIQEKVASRKLLVFLTEDNKMKAFFHRLMSLFGSACCCVANCCVSCCACCACVSCKGC